MKFRNKKTGIIFADISVVMHQHCDYHCDTCKNTVFKYIGSPCKCSEFCVKYPYKAAEVMGYEVLTDEEASLYLTGCPECGSKDIEREPGTRHWACHECGWESEPDRTAKADGGKPRPTLVPPSLMEAVTAVREYGCSKYHDPDNWKRVEPQRYRDAAYRHWLAYLKDPHSVDEESGLPHLWHLACNVAFLIELEKPNKYVSKLRDEIMQYYSPESTKQRQEQWDAVWKRITDTPRT